MPAAFQERILELLQAPFNQILKCHFQSRRVLRVDVLDALQSLEAISRAREERSRFEQISESACDGRGLERVMICEQLGNEIHSVRRDIARTDELVKKRGQCIVGLFLVTKSIESNQA